MENIAKNTPMLTVRYQGFIPAEHQVISVLITISLVLSLEENKRFWRKMFSSHPDCSFPQKFESRIARRKG